MITFTDLRLKELAKFHSNYAGWEILILEETATRWKYTLQSPETTAEMDLEIRIQGKRAGAKRLYKIEGTAPNPEITREMVRRTLEAYGVKTNGSSSSHVDG